MTGTKIYLDLKLMLLIPNLSAQLAYKQAGAYHAGLIVCSGGKRSMCMLLILQLAY
jgi:hypothetical protein